MKIKKVWQQIKNLKRMGAINVLAAAGLKLPFALLLVFLFMTFWQF